VARPFRDAFNRVRNTAGTVVVAAAVKVLLLTVRYRARGWEDAKRLAQHGDGVVYAFWHNVMMMPLGHESRHRTVALVSAGLDGIFAARIVKHFGIASVHGRRDSALESVTSVLEALRALPRGHSLVVTPDGPRGPRYRAQEGAVFLAAKAGLPVVPVGMAFSRSWRLRSWDRFRIAKPFARAEMLFGAAKRFPRDMDKAAIERETAWLEGELHALSREAHAMVGAAWPD
jgi:lysophospholipid acyltransferase (LPLAT)-like uncharacterized protein